MAKIWTVGKAADCAVRVDDPYVSYHHARVHQDDDGTVWVEDLGSTNGTWVRLPGYPTGPGNYGFQVRLRTEVDPPCILHVGQTEFRWGC